MNSIKPLIVRSSKYKMLKLRFNFILLLFLFSIAITDGQIYKRLSIEVGMNRSRNMNTEAIISSKSISDGGVSIVTIESESASYTNNYDFLLGYKISNRHQVRIRFSKNKLGSVLCGSTFSGDSQGSFNSLRNTLNIIDSKSIGALYEYHIPLPNGFMPIGLGFERQKNNFDNSFVFVPTGIFKVNYAIHTAIGYVYPIFQYTYLSAKAFATKSFNNNRKFSDQNNGMYVPLQIGLSVGLKFSLE